MSPPEALDALRQRLDDIDGRILELLRERRDIVSQVVEAKKVEEQPVFVPARELDKVRRFRLQALDAGIDPDWAEDFLRLVMSASRSEQSRASFVSSTGDGRAVLLVGGRGGMGTVYDRLFRATGYEVRILEADDWERVEELATGVAAAIVTVPIGVTETVLERLAPHLPADCVLADFTSTKSGPLAAMHQVHGGPVVGLHPMHGPDVDNVSKQLLMVCPGRGEEAWDWLVRQFELWGMRVVAVAPEDHDKAMDVVQGMRHYLALVHGSFLSRLGLPPERIVELSSPIYRAELMMLGRIFAQQADLYAEIVFANDERRGILLDLLDHHQELAEMVRANDKEAFVRRFEGVADYFGDLAERALEESGYLIYRLADRFA